LTGVRRAPRRRVRSTRHSEAYFGAQRDFWWNPDHLRLLAAKWRLQEVASLVVDIGCGAGHWSRLLYRLLTPGARLLCVDKEPDWAKTAVREFTTMYPSVPKNCVSGLVADATALPLVDRVAGLVTCQTLLIHVADPPRVVREMVRVLKPGGLLVCAEPNNLFEAIAADLSTATRSVESLVKRYEFWLRYQRGKASLGLGDNSVGDLVPGIFSQVGLRDIEVRLSDKANPILPPYSSEEQRTMLEEELNWERSKSGPWDPEELNLYVSAGGGTSEMVKDYLRGARSEAKARRDAVSAGKYYNAGASIMYVVSGRKPPYKR
jgi:SAM-dependent methyltransferase